MTAGWFLPVLIAVISWAGMVFLPKLVAQTSLPPTSAILYEILGGVTVALIVFLYLGGKAQFDAKGAAISYAVGLLGFTGTLAYFWAVTKGPVSIIAVLSAMYPIIAVLLGVFVLHETLSLRQMLGIGLSMAGLWLLVKA